ENNDPGKQFRGLKSGAGYGNLPGTSVYAIAEDLEGEVWVGTDEGVAVFYSPQDVLLGGNSDAEQILVNIDGYTQYLLETEIVKAIAVDPANNKWIGTERAGVFLLSADGTKQIHHFTEDNSPLFSNNITSLTINGVTGEVFIGTAKGLISFKGTSTGPPDPVTDSYYAYPNPVKPGYSGTIAIRGPIAGATVKITDIRGSLIYETMAEYNDTQVEWNGLDMNGRRPNTGVFLVFVSNNDGTETMVTKILFVN
ncbi:MAG TPA: two-component regulator propeller domain-containing protein, partial [Bacteroidales bacterium]|nr:two-component regulator propeller domain-containing protein [Bacteroidales bacterium]